MVRTVVLVSVTIGFAGCGEATSDTSAEKKSAADPGAISKADVPPGEWPFTVSHGTIRCDQGVLFEAPDGTTYAVNGTALGAHKDLPDIKRIWKKDPDTPGLRISLSPIVDKGLKLCDR